MLVPLLTCSTALSAIALFVKDAWKAVYSAWLGMSHSFALRNCKEQLGGCKVEEAYVVPAAASSSHSS